MTTAAARLNPVNPVKSVFFATISLCNTPRLLYNTLDFTKGTLQMANLTISMSAEDKAGISAFCEATGFTISSLFNVFTKAVLRERRIPFTISMPEQPNAETIAAMEEGERIARDPNAKSYTLDEALAEFKKW